MPFIFCRGLIEDIKYKYFGINTKDMDTTKQEIRSFLMALNPEIVRKIDVGEKVIFIRISYNAESRLIKLSKSPAFHIFLYSDKLDNNVFDEKCKNVLDSFVIKEINQNSSYINYCLMPKDALIK
jgi:hypothetical protein